ncbi:MAG: hypothetical protein AAFU03_14195 [Bacteroidota bacterium]
MPFTQRLPLTRLIFLVLLPSACADYPAQHAAHSLDYLEFHAPGGWVLHIDGDGGGQLRCRAHPQRTVIYQPATFQLRQLPQHFIQCAEGAQLSSSACLKAIHFRQYNNQTSICQCPNSSWAASYFRRAIREIKRSPADQRDGRIIRRHWLQEPPFALE